MRYRLAQIRAVPIVVLAGLVAACAGASISVPQSLQPLPEPIASVALAPSGGVLADAIGNELFSRGIRVIDTQQTSNFLVRLNLDEIELMQPKSLSALRERGINAVLSCRSVAGYDNQPQSATVRVVSTSTGELVAAVNWQNGHGGQQGSIADRSMRQDVVEAARQIGEALAKQLHRR
jgi:hypothetical protein